MTNALCVMFYTGKIICTFIRGNDNVCIYIRGTILCITGTVVKYLVVSIVGFFGREIIWLVLSGKGVIVCCMDDWV